MSPTHQHPRPEKVFAIFSQAAMVTSTSTPASMFTIICFTTSVGAFKLFHPVSPLSLTPYSHPLIITEQIKREKANSLNQPLVDPHLERVPRLAALPAGRLARRHLKALGRQPHGALDAQVLGLGALEQLSADFLERADFAGGQGDADFVDFLFLGGWLLAGWRWGRGGREGTNGAFAKVLFAFCVGHCCQSRPERRGSVR